MVSILNRNKTRNKTIDIYRCRNSELLPSPESQVFIWMIPNKPVTPHGRIESFPQWAINASPGLVLYAWVEEAIIELFSRCIHKDWWFRPANDISCAFWVHPGSPKVGNTETSVVFDPSSVHLFFARKWMAKGHPSCLQQNHRQLLD
jgi:hypothetical protein